MAGAHTIRLAISLPTGQWLDRRNARERVGMVLMNDTIVSLSPAGQLILRSGKEEDTHTLYRVRAVKVQE